jgi:hypothetical protein
MKSLLYISRATERASEAEVAKIIAAAQQRNRDVDLTGAIIFTGERFAQFLEGPPDALDAVMSSIARDDRHRDIKLLHVGRQSVRRFPDWEMAYCGPSSFVDRHIRPLFQDLTDAERIDGVDALVELMWALNSTRAVA